MEYFIYTLVSIAVYLVTFAVMWHVFRKREKRLMWDLVWNYQANYFRMCHTFMDAMEAVTQALQAQQAEDETEEAPASDPEDDDPYPEIQMVRADEI